MRPLLIHSATRCIVATLIMLGAGCANVSPTERGILAKPEMQFDADPAHVKVIDQAYVAREGASGGRVTGGGGCGCTM